MSPQNNDERLNEKVAGLTARIDNLEKKTDKLEANSALLFRLSSMMEQQIETNKRLAVNQEKTDEMAKNIDKNLTKITNGQDKISDKMDIMSERIEKVENKVSELEDVNNEQTKAIEGKGKFDILDFITKDAVRVILLALVAAILVSIGWTK